MPSCPTHSQRAKCINSSGRLKPAAASLRFLLPRTRPTAAHFFLELGKIKLCRFNSAPPSSSQPPLPCCFCQAPPGQADLTKAYDALKNRDYDLAIELFHKGIALQPANPGLHKDLAYTLLKTGENAAARDEFAAAQKLNPAG